MSEDDDFPHLKEERKAYRRNVAFAIVGVFLAIGVFVVRMSLRKEREREQRGYAALDRAFLDHDRPAFDMPTTTPPAADRPPVELEVVLGDRRVDVDGESIALGDGRTLELAPRPTRTYAGADFSFQHPATIRVIDQGSVLMSTADATAELVVLETDASDADDLAEMAAIYTGTGQVRSDDRSTHTLLGKQVTGRRLAAAGLVIELMSAKVGKHRRLRVVITGTSAGANLRPLIDAVATVTTKPIAMTPEHDVILRDASGTELARSPATTGEPVKVGDKEPIELVIERRATVKEKLSGMEFEHGPELSALPLALAIPAVQLRAGEIGVQLMAPPMAMTVEDLSSAMFSGQLTGGQEISRTFGDQPYRGMAGELSMGTIAMHVEVFPFKRDGRDFVAMLQFPIAEEKTALKLAAPVIASVR